MMKASEQKEDSEMGMDSESSSLLHSSNDGTSLSSRPGLTSFQSNLTALALEEITAMAHKSDEVSGRSQTLFFRIVKGGNVQFVREVLEHLHSNEMKAELAWCLGDPALWEVKKYKRSCLDRLVNGLWLFLLFSITVIITPVYYVIHTIVHLCLQSKKTRLDTNVKLPLAFALLSEQDQMVKLFLRYGCNVTWPDAEGNTIYHYLADVSLEHEDVAKACHVILCKLINDIPTMRKVITEQENDEGLTALEYTAKYGSISFFEFIIRQRVALGQPVMHVSRHALWSLETSQLISNEMGTPNAIFMNDGQIMQAISEAKKALNVLEVDVSRYDQGDIFGRHSFLLQAIVGRSIDVMTEVSANCILRSKLFSRWMKMKSSRYFGYCLIGHMLNIAITGLLVWYLVNNGGDINPLPLFSTYLMHLSDNLRQAEHQLQLYLNTSNYTDIISMLDNSTSSDYSLHTLTCLAMVNHTKRGTIKCTVNALTTINASCGGMPDEELWENTLGRTSANYEKIWQSKLVLLLLILISCTLAMMILLDLLLRLGFLCANYSFQTSPGTAVKRVFLRWLPGSYLDKQLTVTMASLFFFYIFTHVLMMNTISSRRLWIWKLLRFMNFSVEKQKTAVEEGRLREIINGLTSLAHRINNLETVSNKIMNICILLRFFHAIHGLRLLPNIGFFIITTKKMAKHLIQFALVFVIVSLAFGTIFHFVMRNPQCPALKVVGFETLGSSLFSAYQISLGSGGFSFLENNINAKIAYIAYTITAMLLLLNLIIAVMTTTALELNQSPWRPALCRVETWDEYLGMEAAVMMIALPFKAIFNTWRRVILRQRTKENKSPTIIQLTYITQN